MRARRFKERFKDKSSFVARDGKLHITPENHIKKLAVSTAFNEISGFRRGFPLVAKTSLSPKPQTHSISPEFMYTGKLVILRMNGDENCRDFASFTKSKSYSEKKLENKKFYKEVNKKRMKVENGFQNDPNWFKDFSYLERNYSQTRTTQKRHKNDLRTSPNHVLVRKKTIS